MVNFILIAVCIIAGYLFRVSKVLPGDAHKGINAFIIYVALPAVSFKYLPAIHWSRELLFPVLAPVIVWTGNWGFTKLFFKGDRVDIATRAGLRLIGGLANTSFIGFPLIIAYFGERELSIAIICDQVTFALLATVGIMAAIRGSAGHTLNSRVILKKVFTFPPLLGCIAALTIPRFIDITPLNPLFDKLAGTVGILALFSIGLQLRFDGWREELKMVSGMLLYKLLLAPALVSLLAVIFCMKGRIPQISIFEAAMPTLLTAGVVADEYRLNPALVNIVIGVGIVLSFATTAFWWWVLQYFN